MSTETIDKSLYARVPRPETEAPINDIKPNEIRITSKGLVGKYTAYARSQLEGDDNTSASDSITLKGMGTAVSKAVGVSEIIRRRLKGVHQVIEIGSQQIEDVWRPRDPESSLPEKTTKRNVTSISITLSKQPLDTSLPGYQPPLPDDQVVTQEEEERDAPPRRKSRQPRRGRRGKFRGQRRRKKNGRQAEDIVEQKDAREDMIEPV